MSIYKRFKCFKGDVEAEQKANKMNAILYIAKKNKLRLIGATDFENVTVDYNIKQGKFINIII